ncbi:angiopoietin-related protein 1-like [Anopheles darlingi]|uniref:angiopoietin-related protein 1-like n=1 Tax=Anopheles darlingi TaxID=43151 RepID=UPI00210009F0|nr:angiopoietin-related protein 1-like [Anopheles darlingi]
MNEIDRKLLELQSNLGQHRELMENNKATTTTTTTTATPTPSTSTAKSEPELSYFSSCKQAPGNASGVYLIRVNNDSLPFEVYCEMEKFGGGWIVIQHRFDGSVDFYRDWEHYRNGFGELNAEFWLGLEHIHQITKARAHEMLIEMKDFSDNYGIARYNAFQTKQHQCQGNGAHVKTRFYENGKEAS